jgi:hypothetical protein
VSAGRGGRAQGIIKERSVWGRGHGRLGCGRGPRGIWLWASRPPISTVQHHGVHRLGANLLKEGCA